MARRGRKRLVAKRYPNGHVAEPRQRDLEKEARSVAMEARGRVYGLPCGLMGLSEAGNALGRAFLRRRITREEMEAGHEYEIIRRAARAVMLIREMGSSGDLGRGRSYDGDEGDDPIYVEYCRGVERRMVDSRRVLLNAGSLAQLAVDCWAIEGKEAWGLLGALRPGLQELAKLYQIHRWLKAS